jgi:hypothetical protein
MLGLCPEYEEGLPMTMQQEYSRLVSQWNRANWEAENAGTVEERIEARSERDDFAHRMNQLAAKLQEA